jgi:molybdate/tungstate transport system substrate-binding protein
MYDTAVVEVSGRKPGETIMRRGEPMVYSVTIPKNAPNRQAAEAWVALLLSEKGRAIMERNGQRCLEPAEVDGADRLPDSLKGFFE